MEDREATAPKSAEKPVTPAPRMWSLAFAFHSDSHMASAVEHHYEAARAGDWAKAVLLAQWLSERLPGVPDDPVSAPWMPELTALIHELVDVIERLAPPGRTHKLVGTSPSALRLPCRDCGCVFESRFRAQKFQRTCVCSGYEPKVPDHPRGGLVQYKRGVYPKHRRGQTLGVVEYGQSVVCNHPDCLELVLVTGHNRDYCDEHHRESVRRLRQVRPPKEERFRFRLAPGVNSVQYAWGPRAEVTEVPPGGRFARDEEELLVLASFLAVGSAHADGRAISALVVEDTLR